MTYDGRTRVLVMTEPRRDAIDLVMRDLPAVGPDEALLKIRHAGICGTDLHIIGWNDWAARSYRPPFALGHELCAEIVDLGSAGGAFTIGDRVSVETHLACGTCTQCRAGRGHTCLNLKTFSRLDRGAFADYSVVPLRLLRRIPDGVPDRVGAALEPLGIAVRAAREADCSGKNVLVSGCGPIGLMAIAACRAFGARRVFAAEPAAPRRALAQSAGAVRTFDPTLDDGPEIVHAATRGLGVDLAIETSGAPSAFAAALAMTAPGGTLVVASLPSAPVAVDVAGQIVLREITVRGIYGRLLDRTWLDTERTLEGALDIAPILTDAYPLDDFQAAIDRARSAQSGKVLFEIAPR